MDITPKNKNQSDNNNISQKFYDVIIATGMCPPPPGNIKPGSILRFSNGGEKKNKNGYCVLFINRDGSAEGIFGDWKTGLKERWSYNKESMSQVQEVNSKKQIEESQKEAKEEREKKHKAAEIKALAIWENAKHAELNHSYLRKKKIKPFGLKQSENELIIPIYDETEKIISLQTIKNGYKNFKGFLPGGKIQGGYFAIGNIDENPLYIGEGIATMATVHDAMKKPCIVSFNASNLKPVAITMKRKYPEKEIIICADNDIETEKRTGKNPGRNAGEEAARTINAKLCLCPVDSDFNDLMIKKDINAVKQALEKIRNIKSESFEPLPLPAELLPVKPFDYALLPESLRPWVKDICDLIQCPSDFVAVGVMTSLAAIIGRKIGIRPQAQTDWTVICNLWALVVGRPGVLKSPALEAALAPLNRLVIEANKKFQIKEEIYQLDAMAAKFKKEAGEKQARQILTKNPKADILEVLAVDEILIPMLKRYKANDTSPAALGELLRQNQNGLLVFRDEIVSLLKSLDRDGQDEGRGFYLTAWNGDSSYTFDRIGRGLNLHIPALCLSLLGGTQPGRLSEYIRHAVKGGAADDGLIQRFGLIVWPDTNNIWVDVDRYPNTQAKNEAFKVFEYLDEIEPSQIKAEQSLDINGEPDGIPFLRFDPAALIEFQEWRKNLEQRLRGELHPAIESHLSKYRKLIPSLALILHLANRGIGPVSKRATLQALAWGNYLETHMSRAYGSISQPAVTVAKAILKKIKRGDLKSPFTTTDVWRPGWTNLNDREQVLLGLQLLEDYNYLFLEKIETGGRPKILYSLNEAIK